jgi:hypothetical protein
VIYQPVNKVNQYNRGCRNKYVLEKNAAISEIKYQMNKEECKKQDK